MSIDAGIAANCLNLRLLSPTLELMNSSASSAKLLDRILDSVSECFTQETARALVRLRQDRDVRRRIKTLGAKASAGRLRPEEAREYQNLIEVGDIIATLQIKARRRLGSETPL